ncbi:DNA polymerase delta subunit 2-like, partial [Stegodyphus dumicola]|uniref:DNA polymerase delta subunit 2-like n=1 Tax=Stegodyphus dumicola TaxID=202533 RepID=UPI0015B29D3D
MELHPSILREISEEHNLIPQPVTEEFTKDDDFLILEDNLQRVILCGNIDPHSHVTGVNIAIYGYTEEGGKFFVEDVCYPAVFEPDILPVFLEDRFVVLVSGFGLGDPNVLFPIQLLIDTINGQLGEEQDQKRFSQVIRVIIAGNSIGIHTKDFFAKAKFLTRKSKATTVENVKALDDILAQLVTSVDVDLMPGEFDPANHLLPQQPLHPCMFPKSSKYSTFNVVTNPYHSIIDGVRRIRDGKSLSETRNGIGAANALNSYSLSMTLSIIVQLILIEIE